MWRSGSDRPLWQGTGHPDEKDTRTLRLIKRPGRLLPSQRTSCFSAVTLIGAHFLVSNVWGWLGTNTQVKTYAQETLNKIVR